jgi:hypothetical protein
MSPRALIVQLSSALAALTLSVSLLAAQAGGVRGTLKFPAAGPAAPLVIDLQSYSMSAPSQRGSGAVRGTRSVVINVGQGKESAALAGTHVQVGSHIPELTLINRGPNGQVLQRIAMKQVFVTGYTTTGSGANPATSMSFSFDLMQIINPSTQ